MSRCKKCAAEFSWAKTTTGANMPVEPSPEYGNLVVTQDLLGGDVVTVVPEGTGTHVSHFATCRYASDFRRKR